VNDSIGCLIYLLPNDRQNLRWTPEFYRTFEIFLQTGAVLGLMVVRQSWPGSGKFTIRGRLEVIAGSRVSRSGAAGVDGWDWRRREARPHGSDSSSEGRPTEPRK
jgi:hypothetical protein